MLRCGHCDVICETYEDWLTHLVSDQHQTNLGVSDVFTNHNGNVDRNLRSVIMWRMNPKTNPLEVLYQFAKMEPLSFITDAYVHMFPHVQERFYLIVFDHKKFVDRIVNRQVTFEEQKIVNSMVFIEKKSAYIDSEWNKKIEPSFFYRRHELLRTQLADKSWDDQLNEFLKKIALDQEGYGLREVVIDELEALIREEFDKASVSPFGSCMTWLADVNADLDLYVDTTGEGGRCEIPHEDKLEIMNKINRLLKTKYDGKNVYFIRNARVPIIKLSHPTGLQVDISCDNCLSVQNSKLIRLLTRFDYRIRPLLMFLRYWARFHNLVGPQSIKSYALLLLAFVYLRKKKLVPSVHELQNVEGTKVFTVCNWNAGFCQSRELTLRQYTNLKSIKDSPGNDGLGQEVMKLAHGFFTEYAAFDFENMVVCPLLGDSVPKLSFDAPNGQDLPGEMGYYKANLFTGQCSPFGTNKLLSIQDPFALNVNVTASCKNQDVLLNFKAACSMSIDSLKQYVATYDSCGTVSILELCCQTVSPHESKKQEVQIDKTLIKTEPTDDYYDDLGGAGVETEMNEYEVGLEEFTDFKIEPTENPFTKALREERERARSSNPVRIQRISAYEPSEIQIKSETSPYEETYEKTKVSKKKSVKSVVVVPNQQSKPAESESQLQQEDTYNDLPGRSMSDIVVSINNSNTVSSNPSPVVKFIAIREPKSNDQVVRFVHKEVVQTNTPYADEESTSPEEEEEVNNKTFNYGYEKTVVQPPKSLTKASKPLKQIYKPPAQRIKEEIEKEKCHGQTTETIEKAEQPRRPPEPTPVSKITMIFPKFKIQLDDDFSSEYYRMIGPIRNKIIANGLRNKIDLNVRVLWTNYVNCFFGAENFWEKMSSVLLSWTLKKLASSVTTKMFDEIMSSLGSVLDENVDGVTNSSRKRTGVTSYSGNNTDYGNNDEYDNEYDCGGPLTKLQKTSSVSDIASSRGFQLSENLQVDSDAILLKFSRVPANVRKRCVTECYCRCHPKQLTTLYSQWMKISNQRRGTMGWAQTNPLDTFGKLCEQVKNAVPVAEADDGVVSIIVLLAFDNMSPIPAVLIGFQGLVPEDDPKFKPQEAVCYVMEHLMKDLSQAYLVHSLRKYFK